MTTYHVGDAMRLFAVFTDPATGNPLDPSAVGVRWREPDGTIEVRTFGAGGSPAITKNSTGNYQIIVDTTAKPGTWKYFWFSTGTGQAAEQEEFDVLDVIPAS